MSLIMRRNLMAAKSGEDVYLECVETDGGCAFLVYSLPDTESHKIGVELKMDFVIKNEAVTLTFFGSNRTLTQIWKTGWGNYLKITYWQGSSIGQTVEYLHGGGIGTVKIYDGEFSVNGERLASFVEKGDTYADYSVFATPNGGNKALAGTKLYWVKIWDNGTLVRDIVPVKHGGIVCLKDKITDSYIFNFLQGTPIPY